MSTELKPFEFQSHTLHIVPDEKGNPWFIAKEVCDILGHTNSRKAIHDHCKKAGVTNRYIPTLSNNYSLIDEGNLYRLIIKSNKSEAEPFEAWVCDEVLPSIRKSGTYGNANPLGWNPSEGPLTLAEIERREQALKALSAQLAQAPAIVDAEMRKAMGINFVKAQKAVTRKALHDGVDLVVEMVREGCSREEIASATGKNLNCIRQTIFQARRDGLLPSLLVEGGAQ